MKTVIALALLIVGLAFGMLRIALAARPPELPLSSSDFAATDKNRSFVMAMCSDLEGNLWTANEDGGVWRMDPSAPSGGQWTHFTTNDGLGDDYAYAIDCDNLGRIWVGHLNHGVSVFNGKAWQNYDVVGGVDSPKSMSGPIGDHVFAITVCRSTGDVWMATSAGLTRYVEAGHRWVYYTRREGLPSDQANAIAFDSRGNIFVATQCDGIAMADAQGDYSNWRRVNGPDHVLSDPSGEGLASNRINDICVAADGTIHAATPMGISWSADDGKTWRFTRGTDWADKVTNSAVGAPGGFTGETTDPLLPEDFVTSITQDPYGYLWLGFRTKGLARMVRDGNSLKMVSQNTAVVRKPHAFLPSFDGCRGLVGSYGGGIVPLEKYANDPPVAPAQSERKEAQADLPPGASPPELSELNSELELMSKVPYQGKFQMPVCVAMEDDWRTRGDWMGRYGRYWCILCGMDGDEYQWGSGPQPLEHLIGLGPHHQPNDSQRYWIGEMYNSNPATLELPSIYMSSRVMKNLTTWDKNRRAAELNDNGEVYPATYEGPDLYTNVSVPEGTFILSFYLINDDGHNGAKNPLRDYELVVKQRNGDIVRDVTGLEDQPVLARSRVSDFWAGVYKRFLVQGPAIYSVQIARDYSHNVVLSAVALDQLDERPAPYFTTFEDRDKAHDRRVNAMASDEMRYTPAKTEAEAAAKLVDRLEEMSDWNPQWWAINQRRMSLLLARWYQARPGKLSKEDEAGKTTCLYRAGLYTQWEAGQSAAGLRTARDIEKALRWDGIMPDSTGHGFELVTQYLAAQPATQPAP